MDTTVAEFDLAALLLGECSNDHSGTEPFIKNETPLDTSVALDAPTLGLSPDLMEFSFEDAQNNFLELEAFASELEKATSEPFEPVTLDNNTLSNLSLMEHASQDINDAFHNNLTVIEDPSTVTNQHIVKPIDETQAVIDDVETFLKQQEVENTTKLSQEDSQQAEAILDALIKGTITDDSGIFMDEDVQPESPPQTVPVSAINNISEIITEDGQKILVVITNDTVSPRASPEPVILDSDDSDWTPASPKRKPKTQPKVQKGRVQKRGPYKRSAHATIKDKKERKKLQNVEAARRYRDKKKVEANQVETEEMKLESRNLQLKKQLAEIENEVKTLKKLATELGLATSC